MSTDPDGIFDGAEADVAPLLSGDVAPDSEAGKAILARAGLSIEDIHGLRAIADALDYASVESQLAEVRDAPGVERIRSTVRSLASEEHHPSRVTGRWIFWAAAALLLAGTVAVSSRVWGTDDAEKTGEGALLGPSPVNDPPERVVLRGGVMETPVEARVGDLLELRIEGRGRSGPWQIVMVKRSESTTAEFSKTELARLKAFEGLRMNVFVVSAEGSRAPLYSAFVPLLLE